MELQGGIVGPYTWGTLRGSWLHLLPTPLPLLSKGQPGPFSLTEMAPALPLSRAHAPSTYSFQELVTVSLLAFLRMNLILFHLSHLRPKTLCSTCTCTPSLSFLSFFLPPPPGYAFTMGTIILHVIRSSGHHFPGCWLLDAFAFVKVTQKMGY